MNSSTQVNTWSVRKRIWVTFQRKGFHLYLGAPDAVSYLATRHRHLFKYKVTVDVEHSNRDVEFHMFQTALEALYDNGSLEMDGKSCETLAEELIERVQSLYPKLNFIEVEVSEDGECGGVVSYQKIPK